MPNSKINTDNEIEIQFEEEIEIEDESSEKKFFTMIPNIVYKLGFSPYAIAYYSILKCTAGEKGKCFKSQATIAEEVGCTKRHLRNLDKILSQPLEILNGKSLIKIIHIKNKKTGELRPNLIKIVDIWPENMDIITNEKPIPKIELKNKTSENKEVTKKNSSRRGREPYSAPREPYSAPREPGSHKEERYKKNPSNKNDNRSNDTPVSLQISQAEESFDDDRSLSKDSDIVSSSIVAFDPETYVLPNGKGLSLQMRRALKKYSSKDKEKLYANVCYFETQIKKGKKFDNPESYLQTCINNDYASKELASYQNQIYAKFIKIEHGLRKLELLKTVVRFKRSEKEPYESISYSLPHESFKDALKNYINQNKESGL